MYYQFNIDFTPEEALVYLRKSRSDDPTLTVEEVLRKHEAELDEWTEKNLGGIVPEENKFREVVSGETLKERPEINKVLRLIESPKYKAIAVVEPQRLTRGDLEDIGRLMKLLKHTNTIVITPHRIYDIREKHDWDALETELKRGNDYLEYTKTILNRGRLRSVSEGNYLGSVAPYGYDKTKIKEGKFECPTLKINEEEATVVRMIFDMYVNQDMARHSICKTLDEMKIKPPKGEYWSPPAMKNLLENVHYIGKVKWNWRKVMTIVEDSEIKKTRPTAKIGEYLIYDGKHDAIISEELFDAAQEKTGRNPRLKSKAKIRNPFAGLIYCGCGRTMSLRIYKTKDGKERNKPRMLCDNHNPCNYASCLYDEMVDRVSDVLKQCIEDFELRLNNDESDSIKLHTRLIKNLEAKKKELEAKELAQWESQANPDPSQRMPQHVFQLLNEKLLREKEEVQQALCKAYESMPDPVDYEEKVARFSDALSALHNPDVDAQEKNRLLKACIDRIDYKREKPVRLRSDAKRVTINGRRIKPDGLKKGANWTSPPIELDVKLKV